MFKIFNVTEKKIENDNSIDVEIREDNLVEEDIWQVALDILELEDSIIITAPVAWIPMDDIEISISKNILTISWERQRPMFYNDADKILVEN